MARYPNFPPLAEQADCRLVSSFWGGTSVHGFTAAFGVAASCIDPFNPHSILTTYGYRIPCDPDNPSNISPYYLLTASPVAEAARFEQMMMMRARAGLSLGWLFYPPEEEVTVGPVPDTHHLVQSIRDRYRVSRYRTAVKLVYVIQSSWWAYDGTQTWQNEANFANSLIDDLDSGSYLTITAAGIENRPVIFLYDSGIGFPRWTDSGNAHVTTLTNAILAAGYGTPVYVQCNNNVAQSNTIGCRNITGYGPSGNTPGLGHVAYQTQINQCVANDSIVGANAGRCLNLVHTLDDRPRGMLPDTDTPLYTQYEQHLRNRFALARSARSFCVDLMMHEYSGSEIDEGGDFDPTPQTLLRGANVPSLGLFIDAHVNARNENYPVHPRDSYAARSLHANLSAVPGGWALVQDLYGALGGSNGAYQYSSMQDTTSTTARTLTFTGRRVIGKGGSRAGLGTIRFVFDGGPNNDVNQGVLIGTGYGQTLFDSGVVASGTHTLAVSRVSGIMDFEEWVVER